MMRIRRELVPESSVEAFAGENWLEMVVTERKMDAWQRRRGLKRFIARFADAEVSEGGLLRGEYGTGDTEQEAILDYARRISCERLIVGAARREIEVPRLQ